MEEKTKKFLETLDKDKIIELFLQKEFEYKVEIDSLIQSHAEEFANYKNAYTSLLFKMNKYLQNKLKEEKEMEERKFEMVNNEVVEGILPTRNDIGSAGYDFYVPYDICIPYKGQVSIPLHIKAKMPKDEVLMIFMRSSMGIKNNLM